MAESQTLTQSAMKGRYLTFWTEGQLFGVSIADVVQIIGVQEITMLPDAPHYVKGIITLWGDVIPIIDVRIRLGKPEKYYDERTCIIVTNIYESLIGLIVDAVDEVANIENESISPPPQICGDQSAGYLMGIAKRGEYVILLIHTEQLVGRNEMDQLMQTVLEGAAI